MTIVVVIAFWLVFTIAVKIGVEAGGKEKAFALCLILATLLTLGCQLFVKRDQQPLGYFVVDSLLLIFVMYFALCVDRLWPIWFSSFQMLAVITETARFIFPIKSGFVYANMAEFWAFPALITFFIGVTLDSRMKEANINVVIKR